MSESRKNNKVLFLTDIKASRKKDKSSQGGGEKRPLRDHLFIGYRFIGSLLLILSLTLLLAPDFQLPVTNMILGDVAPFNIKAKKDLLLEDVLSTKKNRELAEENTLPVYDFDLKVMEQQISLIQKGFQHMEEFYTSHIPRFYKEMKEIDTILNASGEEYTADEKNEKRALKKILEDEATHLRESPAMLDREKEFQGLLGEIMLDQKSLKTFRWHHYSADIARGITGLMRQIYSGGVVGNREQLKNSGGQGIVLREVSSGKEQRLENTDNIVDLENLPVHLKELVDDYFDPQHSSLQRVVIKIVSQLVQPNLTFNKNETELRKKKAEESVKPVFFNIKKGEMIVREGERIGEIQLQKLTGMNKESNIHDYALSLLGLFVFSSLIISLAWSYLLRYRQDMASRGRDLFLIGSIILANFLIFRLAAYFSQPIAGYLNVAVESVYYAIPFAAASMLTALLFDLDIAIMITILNFALVGTHLEWKLGYSLVALMGGLFAVLRKNTYKHRASILHTGLIIGLLNAAMIVPLDLADHTLVSPKGLSDIAAGFMGGIMVTLVVSWLLPVFETLFHVNSDIKLQEISNLNHPLLRKMIVEAPGTYHHSIVVSTLAEGAAEAVGANPLLARVGAYYHDIGKMKKPEYFIENQKGGKNKHDKLAPSMSALIVASHVKDGVELARAHRLNPLIIDFIKEHHGTTLMKYFYDKAKKGEAEGAQVIEESRYRYGGPKPQSRETAIVSLADVIEAAARSMPEPTVSRLQALVEKVISEKLMDGELDNCDLTLRDLNLIGRVFVGILTGIFHSRIEYPERKGDSDKTIGERKEGEFTNDGRSAHPAAKKGDSAEEIKVRSQGNIKKFRIT